MNKTITVKGMSCGHCQSAVQSALESLPELKDVKVDLNAGRASFYAPDDMDLNRVKTVVEQAGFEAHV